MVRKLATEDKKNYTVQDGYIIYTRGKDNPSPIWRYVYDRAVREAASIKPIFNSGRINTEIGDKLKGLGEAEAAKERALISAAGIEITSDADEREFVQKFNQVLIGKKNYEKALERINYALNTSGKTRAPSISSWFGGYLTTALNEKIKGFINREGEKEKLLSGDYSDWEESFDDIINRAILSAVDKMLKDMERKPNKELYGDSETWRAYYEAWKALDGLDQDFIMMIRSKLNNFDGIRDIFSNMAEKKIDLNNVKNKGISSFIKSGKGLNLGSEKKSRGLGGSVQEFLENVANSMGEGVQKSASSGHKVMQSEILKTDNIQIFSYERDIDVDEFAQGIVEEINDELLHNTSLNNAARTLKDYYNNNLSRLNNTFIVYGSTKSYSLADSFRGFHNGGRRKLSELPELLESAKVATSTEAQDFIYKLYNTAKYAIYEDERNSLTEEGKKVIMSAMANLLFDDWETIGDTEVSGAKSIHVLQLEGIQVPLSSFLKAAGQAVLDTAADMEQYFHVSLSVLPSAKEEWANPYNGRIPITGNPKDDIQRAWNEQREAAINESFFTTTFLSNFKTLIGKLITES